MLLLFEIGITASFVVYQTVKIWQTATLHHILWSVKKFFEDFNYLEEVDFSKSSLLNDHVSWQQQFLCTLKAHQSKWNRFSHSLACCVWAEVKWDHGSTAPNLQTWSTSLLSLCHPRDSWCLPQWPLFSPAVCSPAVQTITVFKLYFFYAGHDDWNISLLYFCVVFLSSDKVFILVLLSKCSHLMNSSNPNSTWPETW